MGYNRLDVHGFSFLVCVYDFALSSERFYFKSMIWTAYVSIAYLIWFFIFEAAGLETLDGKPYLYVDDLFEAAMNIMAMMIGSIGFASLHALIKGCILAKYEKQP